MVDIVRGICVGIVRLGMGNNKGRKGDEKGGRNQGRKEKKVGIKGRDEGVREESLLLQNKIQNLRPGFPIRGATLQFSFLNCEVV